MNVHEHLIRAQQSAAAAMEIAESVAHLKNRRSADAATYATYAAARAKANAAYANYEAARAADADANAAARLKQQDLNMQIIRRHLHCPVNLG